MTPRGRAWRAGLPIVLGLAAWLAACAPALAPAPVVTAPTHPEFMFPATPAGAERDLVARQQRGWQFLQAGDTRGARREFNEALRASATFYAAEAGLAYASLADKDYAAAVGGFNRVLRRVPRYVPALVGRGDAQAAAGDVDEALRSFQAALAEDATLADVRRRIDVLNLRRQQEALKLARQAADAGRYDQAAAAYEQAIAGSPDSAFLFRELAGVERRKGDATAALRHLRKAVSLDGSDARAWFQLGELLDEQGDHSGAVEAFGRALALEPGDEAAARLARARGLDELGRLPEAYRAIPTVLQISRGDLAALVGVRLGALLKSAPPVEVTVLTDIRSHWAATWIMNVVRAGVMEPYPNHTFQPRGLVRRLELAEAVTRLLGLIAARRPALGREWAAARPRIADLPFTHLGYPAASMAVAAGVMPLADGSFRPGRAVSGAEALDAIGRLEGLAR
jgi:tetratricopeptide (TPR) repeat protein